HAAMGLARMGVDVEILQPHAAGERPLEAGADPHQSRFAGAVRPDQRRDGAGCDLEADIVQRAMAGIIEDQVFDAQHRWVPDPGSGIRRTPLIADEYPSVPDRRLNAADAHVLNLEVILDTVLRALAAEAGFLDAAERRHFGRDQAGIDADDA